MPAEQIEAITVDRNSPTGRAENEFQSFSEGRDHDPCYRRLAQPREVKRAMTVSETGTTPGWDFAGVVEATGDLPDAPAVGTRVVGMVPSGAWASRVAAPLNAIAVIPDGVTDAQAASLPVAGLTALHALRKGGLLVGRKVLVDGATAGVGHFVIQLAAASGALVYAHIRREKQRKLVEASSAGGVIVGESLDVARSFGPFDLIIDSVGGSALSAALTMLARNGVCVTFGASEGEKVSFDSGEFFRASGTSLKSFILGDDIAATEREIKLGGILGRSTPKRTHAFARAISDAFSPRVARFRRSKSAVNPSTTTAASIASLLSKCWYTAGCVRFIVSAIRRIVSCSTPSSSNGLHR